MKPLRAGPPPAAMNGESRFTVHALHWATRLNALAVAVLAAAVIVFDREWPQALTTLLGHAFGRP